MSASGLPPTQCTGFSGHLRAKLRDRAVRLARAGCYSPVAVYSNGAKTRYSAQGQDNVFLCPGNRIDGQDSPIDGASIA